MADPERFRVDQDEGDPRGPGPAVDPGVIRAALHEHVSRLELHRRIVHLHLELARENDHVVDRLCAVHGPGPSRRNVVHGEPGPVRRRRRAQHARAHVFDIFAHRNVGGGTVGAPDEGRDAARLRTPLVRGRRVDEDFCGLVRVVPRHHAADHGRGYFASSTRVEVAGPSPTMISQASSSFAPSQCTCFAKWVTNEPVGMATVRLGSNLLPVVTHQVPLITVMKRSFGWKCGRLKLPGLNRFMTTYSPGFSGSPTSTAWLMPAAPVGSRHLS